MTTIVDDHFISFSYIKKVAPIFIPLVFLATLGLNRIVVDNRHDNHSSD